MPSPTATRTSPTTEIGRRAPRPPEAKVQRAHRRSSRPHREDTRSCDDLLQRSRLRDRARPASAASVPPGLPAPSRCWGQRHGREHCDEGPASPVIECPCRPEQHQRRRRPSPMRLAATDLNASCLHCSSFHHTHGTSRECTCCDVFAVPSRALASAPSPRRGFGCEQDQAGITNNSPQYEPSASGTPIIMTTLPKYIGWRTTEYTPVDTTS